MLVLRVKYNGPALARFVEDQINGSIRGHVEIESIEWPMAGLHRVISGGWVPVTVRGVKVWDAYGRKVIDTPYASAEIDTHSAIFGRHDIVLRNISIPRGGYALIRQVPEPYPKHEYDFNVVSLISAFYARHVPSFWAGESAAPKLVFDLRNYDIRGVTLDVEFPGFDARLWNVRAKGFLMSDGSLPLSKKLFFSLAPKADRGLVLVAAERIPTADLDPLSQTIYRALSPFPVGDEVLVGGRAIVLDDIVASKLRQLPMDWPRDPIAHDVDFALRAHSTDGADVELAGSFKDYWNNYFGGDHDTHLRIENAGKLAARLSDDIASGDQLELSAGVTGPSLNPKLSLGVHALDLAIPVSEAGPPLDLHLASSELSFDLATEEGELKDTVAQGSGGEVRMGATFGLRPYHFDLDVDITQPIFVGQYVPRDVRQLAGAHLRGHLRAHGTQNVQEIDDLDVWLGRARLQGKLVREEGRIVHADMLRARLGATSLAAKGWVDFDNDSYDLFVRFGSGDAARYLRHFGAPALAHTLHGDARVEGTFAEPKATAFLSAGGVPVVDTVNARLSYRDKLLDLIEASSKKLGGTVSGRGRVALGATPRVLGFTASARDLDLSRIPVVGAWLQGIASGKAEASGPTDRLHASVDLGVHGLSVADDPYDDLTLSAKLEPDGTKDVELHVSRKAGGKLDAVASVARDQSLGGVVTLRDVSLASLAILGGESKSPVGGIVNTELRLNGTASAPTADGTLSIDRFWFGNAFLGKGELNVERVADGKVHLEGRLFQGRATIEGDLDTSDPRYLADLRLRVRRLELDQFLPALAEKMNARGWITGEIGIHTQLAGGPDQHPEVSLELTEAMLLIDNEDAKGRPAPVRLRNRTPITVFFDGTTARLMDDAVIEGPAGDFTLSGWGRKDELALQLGGDVAVKLLEPYLREYFDEMSGTLTARVDVTGTLTEPRVTGTVEVDKVSVRPAGQEAVVSIPTGKIEVTNDQIAVTGVAIHVDDSFSDEHGELTVRGGVKLKDFEPQIWALQLDGQLAGKMLLVAAPKVFSTASGLANLSLSLHGFGAVPNIDGSLRFDDKRPLSISPRGVGHELTLNRGTVTFTDQDVELDGVRGWIDDEGRITDMSGVVGLENWQPVDVDVSVSATTLPFRVPDQLDLTLNLHNLRLVGEEATGLDVLGTVEIVDGRYIRDFNLVTDVLTPERTEESSTPFYEEIPIVANARLDLRLEARAFFVQNNVANIELNGLIEVTGTVADPKLDGEVLVDEGSFKFPTMRATFTRTSGSVRFSKLQQFPEYTPELSLRSESDYRDTRGQEHLITLELTGTLDNLKWDLYTSSGLNKTQTVSLLLTGRTTEEIRQSLGDEPVGTDPTQLDRTDREANPYDQLVKDVAGDFISLLIEDKLKDLTKLDVVRLEIGTTSVGFHLEKDLFKNLRLLTDWERDLRESSLDLRGELRLSDTVFFEGELLNRNFDDDSEEDISEGLLRLVFRKLRP